MWHTVCFECVEIMKVEVHLKSDHAGQDGEWTYSFTLSLTSVLDGSVQSLSGRFNRRNDPLYEAAWTTGAFKIGAENPTHIGIRSPDRPDRSHSLFCGMY